MDDKSTYALNGSGDAIAGILARIARAQEENREYEKKMKRNHRIIDSGYRKIIEMQSAGLIKSGQPVAAQETASFPTKQKFGWNSNYKIDELYAQINGILIETMPFQNFCRAYTGEGEPVHSIKILRRKGKEFVDLHFHLYRKGITLNTSFADAIKDRCLIKNKGIAKHNIQEYISGINKQFTFLEEPLYNSTSRIISRLEKTKLSSD